MQERNCENPEGAENSPKVMKIGPSMLASDFARLGEEIQKVEKAGGDCIHLDVMDGVFVPNITMGPPVIRAMRPYTQLPFDVHLMIEDPEVYVERFAKAGADWLSFHLEAKGDPAQVIRKIREAGMQPGIALKPATPVESVYPYLKDLFLVLVMTVEPGFGGQKMMVSMLEKVRLLKEKARKENPALLVEIDGGVNRETVSLAAAAGVDICVAGTGVFKAEDPALEVRILKQGGLAPQA